MPHSILFIAIHLNKWIYFPLGKKKERKGLQIVGGDEPVFIDPVFTECLLCAKLFLYRNMDYYSSYYRLGN